MTFCFNIVEADKLFVVVVFFRVAATLIKEGDILAVVIKSRQGDVTGRRDYLFGSRGVNPTIDVGDGRVGATQAGEDEVLLRTETCFKWAINVLSSKVQVYLYIERSIGF